jgi:hypothetical protein
MQSMVIITKNPEGLIQEFSYECNNEATALALIDGTLKGCKETGWSLISMQAI